MLVVRCSCARQLVGLSQNSVTMCMHRIPIYIYAQHNGHVLTRGYALWLR